MATGIPYPPSNDVPPSASRLTASSQSTSTSVSSQDDHDTSSAPNPQQQTDLEKAETVQQNAPGSERLSRVQTLTMRATRRDGWSHPLSHVKTSPDYLVDFVGARMTLTGRSIGPLEKRSSQRYSMASRLWDAPGRAACQCSSSPIRSKLIECQLPACHQADSPPAPCWYRGVAIRSGCAASRIWPGTSLLGPIIGDDLVASRQC